MNISNDMCAGCDERLAVRCGEDANTAITRMAWRWIRGKLYCYDCADEVDAINEWNDKQRKRRCRDEEVDS